MQSLWPAQEVANREHNIDAEVEANEEQEEHTPRHRQEVVIEIERAEKWETCSGDVIRAVLVQKPFLALLQNSRTEAKILVFVFLSGRSF